MKLKDGAVARVVTYNMEEYLRSTVEKYCTLVKKNTGKLPTLRHVSTPLLSEDHKEAPAAKPVAEGDAISCPWCKHSFPASEHHNVAADKHNVQKEKEGVPCRENCRTKGSVTVCCICLDEDTLRGPHGKI